MTVMISQNVIGTLKMNSVDCDPLTLTLNRLNPG